ncbi:MAG: integrase domain-containing protein [Rhodanobacteraceae bacterium]
MSIKTHALSSAIKASLKAAGASLTRRARVNTATAFVSFLFESNYQVQSVASLGVRHVALFIEARRGRGDSLRTLQNKASHIRCLLRAEGRAGLADDPLLTNKALGIAGASRGGTNRAVSPEADSRILQAAQQLPDYALAAVRLQRTLGLRVQEAVRSGPSLARWVDELLGCRSIHVVAGTKGGRRRDVQPFDREQALAAVRFAIDVLRRWNREDLFPQRSLKQAIAYYRNVWNRCLKPASESGCTSHSYRYTFTQDRILQCLEAGMSKRDALASVALDLGHGDGRGRYVLHVYAQAIALLKRAS